MNNVPLPFTLERIFFFAGSLRNFTIGPSNTFSLTVNDTRPLALYNLAISSNFLISLEVKSCSINIPFILPFSPTLNALNPEILRDSVKSISLRSYLTSGLSDP